MVDSSSNMVEWGYCNNNCPGVLPPSPMYVHPENQIGKCSCGVPNTNHNSRIVGGEETQIGEYPWQVSLMGSNSTENHFCGGTLVGDKYVVTAAHCTDGESASDLWISIGDNNLGIENEITSFTIGVKSINQHPSYDSTQFINDISVLELERAVDFRSYPNIKPICLPAQDADYTGEVATNTGWGRLNTGFPGTSKLHEVDLAIYADDDCGNWDGTLNPVSPGRVCAGVRGGGKGSCNGDSGGPLVVKDPNNNGSMTLVGVVSYGSGAGCAVGDWYTVYAEASYYRSWINSKLNNLDTCSPPDKGNITNPSCPISMPDPSTSCTPGFKPYSCEYGEECCCGTCYPSMIFTCELSGGWIAMAIDFCMNPSCTTVCPQVICCGSDGVTYGTPCDTPNGVTCVDNNPCPDCWKENKALSKLANHRKLRVPSAQRCFEICQEDDGCEYFQFKNPGNKPKGTCFLKEMTYKNKSGVFSGNRNCTLTHFH